jgi:glycosyltransferase involved in cell wall biosynthesis
MKSGDRVNRHDVPRWPDEVSPTGEAGGETATERPIRCLMLGLGSSTFINDWGNAVARFAEVVGVTAVKALPEGATRISPRMAADVEAVHPLILIRAPRLRPKRLLWPLNMRAEARLVERAARYLIRRHGRIDVIHSHGYASAGAVPLVARRLELPFVHTEHSSNLATTDPLEHVTKAGLALVRRVYGAAASVIFVGDVQQRAVKSLGLTGNFRVIPNPVDASLFDGTKHPPGRSLHLVTIGYLQPRKRMELLIRAFRLVRNDIPSIRLDIVGGGVERDRLERLVGSLGLDDAVVFHGSLARPDVASVLKSADLYVHTSERESFGVSIVEALLTGLPVVAVRCGGVTEELPVSVATVIEPPEAEVVAEAITKALSAWPFASRTEIASWARERYGMDSVARGIEAVYREVLG